MDESDLKTVCMKHGTQNAIGNHNECEACLLEQKELNQAREVADDIDSRIINLLSELDDTCENIDLTKRSGKYSTSARELALSKAITRKHSLICQIMTANQEWLEARINVAERMC